MSGVLPSEQAQLSALSARGAVRGWRRVVAIVSVLGAVLIFAVAQVLGVRVSDVMASTEPADVDRWKVWLVRLLSAALMVYGIYGVQQVFAQGFLKGLLGGEAGSRVSDAIGVAAAAPPAPTTPAVATPAAPLPAATTPAAAAPAAPAAAAPAPPLTALQRADNYMQARGLASGTPGVSAASGTQTVFEAFGA